MRDDNHGITTTVRVLLSRRISIQNCQPKRQYVALWILTPLRAKQCPRTDHVDPNKRASSARVRAF